MNGTLGRSVQCTRFYWRLKKATNTITWVSLAASIPNGRPSRPNRFLDYDRQSKLTRVRLLHPLMHQNAVQSKFPSDIHSRSARLSATLHIILKTQDKL